MRNPRSVAVDGRIGCHDPLRFAGGLPGRYGHRLLPVCCPDDADPDLRDDDLNRPLASTQLHELESRRPEVPPNRRRPLVTTDARTRPLRQGSSADPKEVGSPNVSRLDPSGAVQVDAAHPSHDRKVG